MNFSDTTGAQPLQIKDLEVLFSKVISVALAAAGIALFIMLLIGGFNYLTAGADAGKAQAGQKTITTAITGIILIALSYLILTIIANFTGFTNILNFSVYVTP